MKSYREKVRGTTVYRRREKDFVEKVSVPNKLYGVIKAIRTKAPGVCIAGYDYAFGPHAAFHEIRSKGIVAELVSDFQVTDGREK